MADLGSLTFSKHNTKADPKALTGSSTVDSLTLVNGLTNTELSIQLVGTGAWAWSSANVAFANLEPVASGQTLTLLLQGGESLTIYLGNSSGTVSVHAKSL